VRQIEITFDRRLYDSEILDLDDTLKEQSTSARVRTVSLSGNVVTVEVPNNFNDVDLALIEDVIEVKAL
jgi:hypothetical protein